MACRRLPSAYKTVHPYCALILFNFSFVSFFFDGFPVSHSNVTQGDSSRPSLSLSATKPLTKQTMSAAAGLFQSGPAEVLQEIVSHASSLQDVLSFDLICKHAHQAWLAQNAGLRAAWNVLARGLPAAEQALVAVGL